MPRHLLLAALLGTTLLTAACGDGNPLFEVDTDGDGIPDDEDPDADGDGVKDDEEDDGGVGGDPDLPPGTDSPSSESSILRYEDQDDSGGGYVQTVSYDAATDTFTVDNLAFDGDNSYDRGVAVSQLSSSGSETIYAVYEGEETSVDIDGNPTDQLTYRAIYGVSTNATTVRGETLPVSRFAIVRSGSYVGYGFGGFVYERNGGVDLPEAGFATYSGEYAGMRVFQNLADLEYTRGDVSITIDFNDFNAGNGVLGRITNREAFDIDGNPIVLGSGDGELRLPNLTFVITPGAMTEDGEISAGIQSATVGDGGALETYESGTYYAIIGGEDASEIVGVFVVESDDPRYEGVTAQETGGFIVYR